MNFSLLALIQQPILRAQASISANAEAFRLSFVPSARAGIVS